MAHIHKISLINAPVEKVYPVARDPQHWNEWWVGLSEAEEITGKGEPGTISKHHYKMAGISFPVTNTVVEDKSGKTECLWKGKFDGPLAGQHQWTYKAKGNQTEVVVDLDYTGTPESMTSAALDGPMTDSRRRPAISSPAVEMSD